MFLLLHINLPRTLDVVLWSWYRLITCPLSSPFWSVFFYSTSTGSTASPRFLFAYLLAVCHLHKVRICSIRLGGVGGRGVIAPSPLSECVQPSLHTISCVADLIVVGVTLMERFLTRGRGSLLEIAVRNMFNVSRSSSIVTFAVHHPYGVLKHVVGLICVPRHCPQMEYHTHVFMHFAASPVSTLFPPRRQFPFGYSLSRRCPPSVMRPSLACIGTANDHL